MSNFINEHFKIDFSVPVALQESINCAEQADKDNDYGTYITYADNIDILAKNCYTCGKITKKMWEILSNRYS